jgi:carboxymethylenebutenolidase
MTTPVLGFYGENDARVASTVQATIAAMERLGKVYELHIYPKATHSFVMFQNASANTAAIEDAWPKAITFLKKHIG